MTIKESSLVVIAMMIVGVLLIWLEAATIGFVVLALGIAVATLGLIDLFQKQWLIGALKLAIGIAVILLTHFVVEIVIYILAVLLIVWGVYQIYLAIKAGKKNALGWALALVVPVLSIVTGVLLIINSGIVFILAGVLLILEAVFMLVDEYVLTKN